MQELQVTCFGLSETNTTFQGNAQCKWNNITRRTFKHSRIITSESDIQYDYDYKPGGTLTAIIGKWQSRISAKGTDSSGLGRWSYFILSSNKRNLVIITAYKPIKTQGPQTAWTQQWILLRETQREPDPIKAFCEDLTKETKQWVDKGYDLILMIDANEEVGIKPGGLSTVISTAGLFDLLDARHHAPSYPNTFARGSKRINYIFGTERVRQHCANSGLLPFGFGYPSDHRAVFIRVDISKILSTTVHASESASARLLISATPKEREKFVKELTDHYRSQNLYQRLQDLWETAHHEWTPDHTIEFNKCDEQHIIGMIAAEKKTCKVKTTAWSPTYSQVVENKAFWKIALSLRRTYVKPNEKFQIWAAARGIEDLDKLDTKTIVTHLREAQKAVRDMKLKANQLREDHLRELLNITQENGDDKQHERRLQILLRAHRRQHSYKRLQQILKPQERNGLSYVLIPENFQPENYPYNPQGVTKWEMIHKPDAVTKYIMSRNITHFGQAHGSPFTIPPLNTIQWAANDPASEAILQGNIPKDLLSNDSYVNEVLQGLAKAKQLPEIDTYLTNDDVARGFKKWKESTSTSPSGCHLGLRRISTTPLNDKELDKSRTAILAVQTHVINIPIHIGFSPERWKTVTNAMLEKTPGSPFLHKLRVIHILEADYNLSLKAIFGRRLMRNCEQHGTLGNLQDGFRKGRSTTRTLLHNEIVNDYNKRLRIDNYVGMTDISGCFDRILPPIISLLNRKNGCPKEAVKMHADTLYQAKYHLKTQHGITADFYSNNTTPVYGNGQGAGDSPSQWSQESALLFELYQNKLAGATLCNRHGEIPTQIPLAAFADDTNLFGNNNDNQKSRTMLTAETKNAFSTWNGLLNATGHFMELSKCSCYLQFWQFQEDGYAFTEDPATHGQEIRVKDQDGQFQLIPQLRSNESQKLLGVMKNPMGDQQDEIELLKQKSDNIAKRINSNRISRSDARIAYEVFYIPAVRYPLNITSINQVDLEMIQSKAVLAFLAAQGFNRHMPREIVFAPTLYQGIGFRHLYDLQGSDSTRLLFQEINQEQSMTQQMLLSLLDTIQLESGLGNPILENCKPLDYLEWGWIPQIRDFLWHINGRIIGATEKPPTYREHDSYLMDSTHLNKFSRREKIYIHRCRLHLQVATISDIATTDGTQIHSAWFAAEGEKPSTSTIRWPRQPSPNRIAWKAWTALLKHLCNESGKLCTPLGQWTQRNNTRIHPSYFEPGTQQLWIRTDTSWTTHRMAQQHRRHWRFESTILNRKYHLTPTLTPVDINHIDRNYIMTTTSTDILKAETSLSTTTWFQKSNPLYKHIVGQVTLLLDPEELHLMFENKAHVEIASDGGHEPESGISTFGWAIAVNKTLIAKGRGPAQAHPLLAESFRSEGYGLTSSMVFIHNLLDQYNIIPDNHTWTIYIDNKALIQRMDGYSTRVPIPRWNLRSDEDITGAARSLITRIPVQLQHVKSHQDERTDWDKLSLPAQLNIIADAQATHQRQVTDKHDPTVQKIARAQLQINNIAITRDSQKWLLQAAARIPVQEYYYQKWKWTTKVFDSISWKTQKQAQQHFNINDQTRITKFVHGWLPTQHRQHKEGAATSPRCLLCQNLYDDNLHLFNCDHPDMVKTQDNVKIYLMKSLHDHGNSELTNIIELALDGSLQKENWMPSMSDISPNWHSAVLAQNSIGWRHIYFGRISVSLIKAMDEHYRSLQVNMKQYSGERWAKKLIINIWTTLLQLWKQRNEIIFNNENQRNQTTMRDKIVMRIQKCYSRKQQLTAAERRNWFDKSLEEKLQEDTTQLQLWLSMIERLFRITTREQRKRPTSSRIMDAFLRLPQASGSRNQPNNIKNHPRAYPQELNPD